MEKAHIEIVDLLIKMVIFHSYVSLPAGNPCCSDKPLWEWVQSSDVAEGSHPFRTGTLQPNGHEPKDQQELNVVAIWLYGCVRKWRIPPTWINLATLKGKMMITLW